ncbi:hypothetical protein ACJX0J_011649, partial [Zea mays]
KHLVIALSCIHVVNFDCHVIFMGQHNTLDFKIRDRMKLCICGRFYEDNQGISDWLREKMAMYKMESWKNLENELLAHGKINKQTEATVKYIHHGNPITRIQLMYDSTLHLAPGPDSENEILTANFTMDEVKMAFSGKTFIKILYRFTA